MYVLLAFYYKTFFLPNKENKIPPAFPFYHLTNLKRNPNHFVYSVKIIE